MHPTLAEPRASRPGELYRFGVRAAWALLFFTLPASSFPYLPEALGGRALERPLALYPLLFLALAALPLFLLKRPLPRTLLPLLAFLTVAGVGSVVAFGGDLESLRGVSLLDRFMRNVLTLGIGAAFYLTTALLPRNRADLRFSLRWLYAGMLAALAWGSLQAVYVIHYIPRYFRLLNEFQSLVSTRKLFATRISGLTYEPKWFAEQIVFLLTPWLLASVLTGTTLFPRLGRGRFRWVTVELASLFWAAGVLVFTYSRSGLFILAVQALLAFWMWRISAARPDRTARADRPRARRRRLVIESAALLLLIAASMFVAGSQNPYFSRLWRYWTEDKARARSYLEYIAFEQRFVYWSTALRMYQQSPLVGVGLGNYAFYFADLAPDQPYDTQREVMRQITPGDGRDRLITAKNLYARLIAETGLLGTAFFAAFLLAACGCVLYLWFSPDAESRFWATGGAFSLVTLGVVLFSFDSFARPNMWIALGLITAAAHLTGSQSYLDNDASTPPES